MNIQNPETKDVKTGNEEDKILDLAYKLAKGEMTLDELPEDKQREFHERFVVDKEEIPEPSDPKPDEGEAKLESGLSESTETKPDENQEFLKERKRRLDELNTITQKKQNAENRLAELEAIETVVHEKPKGDEIFSEESTVRLHERLNKLEANQKTTVESEKTILENESKILENRKIFTEISSFQFENPDLKTSKPMETLNAGYKKFIEDIGGLENVERFRKDKVFREQKESEGLVFPMNDKDFGNFEKISSAIKYKREKNYPDLDSAYYKHQKENGIVSDSVRQASLTATKQVLEKIATADNTQTLSPGDGQSADENGGWTTVAMEKWLYDNPTPSTPKEMATAKQIHEILFPRGG